MGLTDSPPLAYIGQPAMKKMGAKQAYSVIHGVVYLPLCFLGFSGVLMSIIAVVAINPIVVSRSAMTTRSQCVVSLSLEIFIGLIICSDTLAITPQRHYPAFLLGTMSVVADWAQGTIVNGVSNAYSNFTLANVQFSPNVTAAISGFSYRGLINFAGGSLLQSVFLTAILMYMIDRKFVRAAVWSTLAAVFSLFGLINAKSVGVLVRTTDDGWRFSVAYLMLTGFFLVLEVLQRNRLVSAPETEPDDLSSVEWAEWMRQRALGDSSVTELINDAI